jgi:hypothetical protein
MAGRWILAFAATAMLAAAPVQAQTGARNAPVDLELALGVDISRSVDYEEARLQRDGYVAAFRHPSVHGAIKSGMLGRIAVSYYEWSGYDQYLVAKWTVIGSAEEATRFADRLAKNEPQAGRRTGISAAIDYGAALFDNNGIEGVRRVIDLSGDGPNNAGVLVTIARDRAVARRITINGLPILNDRPTPSGRPPLKNLDLYYRDCVIGGPRAFYIVANNFEDFARAVLRKLILEIADLDPVKDANHALLRELPPQPGSTLRRFAGDPGMAAARQAPPCNIGEQQRRQWWGDIDDDWMRPGPVRP